MRVISGYLKGRKLLFPVDRKHLRPTKDVTREAIFDVLREWIMGKRVLDLFAGTGALGIEAVSHGASEVVFVESEAEGINLIRRNVEALDISGNCSVKKGKVERVITEFEKERFNLVIADPPYGYPENKMESILKNIVELQVIDCDGIIVIEHGRRDVIPGVDGLRIYKEKFYGKSTVSYLRLKNHNEKDSGLSGQL